MTTKQNTKGRVAFFAALEAAVVAIDPRFAGKMDWNSARYYHDAGWSVDKAAQSFVANNDPVAAR